MSDPDTQALDSKNEEKQTNTTDNSGSNNDVPGFLSSVIGGAVLTMVLAILGANFIYIVRNKRKHVLFPTALEDYWCEKKMGGGGRRGQRGGAVAAGSCGGDIFGGEIKAPEINLAALLGFDGRACGWPYSMKKGDHKGLSWAGYKNWIADSTAHTFKWNREQILKLLGVLEGVADVVPEAVMMIIGMFFYPLIQLMGVLVYFSSFFFGVFDDEGDGLIWSALNAFLPFWATWLMPLGNSISMMIQLLVIFLIAPLVMDRQKIGQIIKCNGGFLGFVFASFVVSAAAAHLDSTISTGMTIAWVVLVLKALYEMSRKS